MNQQPAKVDKISIIIIYLYTMKVALAGVNQKLQVLSQQICDIFTYCIQIWGHKSVIAVSLHIYFIARFYFNYEWL